MILYCIVSMLKSTSYLNVLNLANKITLSRLLVKIKLGACCTILAMVLPSGTNFENPKRNL